MKVGIDADVPFGKTWKKLQNMLGFFFWGGGEFVVVVVCLFVCFCVCVVGGEGVRKKNAYGFMVVNRIFEKTSNYSALLHSNI